MSRYDVLVAPVDGGHALPDAALRAVVRDLAARGFAQPVEEAVARTWVELRFEPGTGAHELFGKGPGAETFSVAILRVSTDAPFPRPFGSGPPVRFALTLYGAPAEQVQAFILQRLRDATNLRLETFARPAGEVPALSVVPEDERRAQAGAARTGGGRIGTDVEEF